MQLHACFWDDSTSTRKARIEATRRMDRSRSFLVSQAIDPIASHGGSCGTLCILQYTKGCPSLLYILIGNGKDVWGRVLHSSGERVWLQRGCTGGYALSGLRSS